MDEVRRLAMRRKHAKYGHFCTCGRIVRGNGGKASHRAAHERNGDVHHYITRAAWVERFGENGERDMADNERRAVPRCHRCGREYPPTMTVGIGLCAGCVTDVARSPEGEGYEASQSKARGASIREERARASISPQGVSSSRDGTVTVEDVAAALLPRIGSSGCNCRSAAEDVLAEFGVGAHRRRPARPFDDRRRTP